MLSKTTKHCPKCLQEKDLTAFHKAANRPDGFQAECRDCKRVRNANRKKQTKRKTKQKKRQRRHWPEHYYPYSRMKTYLLTDGTAYKIGRALDPKRRIENMQTGNPRQLQLLHVLSGDWEQKLHRQFAEHSLQGEWFAAVPQIVKEFETRSEEAAT